MQQRVESVHGALLRTGGLPCAIAGLLRALLADGLQHGELAVEVVIEAALGEVHLREDVLHGRPLVALCIEQALRGRKQLVAALISLFHWLLRPPDQ